MLTLDPNSVCDVCAEEYGPNNLPRSIPCGHVLCEDCSTTICQKTPSSRTPVCPFCREPFTADSIRLIRADYSLTTGTSSRPEANHLGSLEANEETILVERRLRDDDRPQMDPESARREARRLEDKVAKVASKKCSVEEVHTLHKELQSWLTSSIIPSSDEQHAALQLSAALIRAILMNHVAHSEASKVAKGVEQNLREQLEDAELSKQKLDAENRKQKALLAQKTQECQQLKTELNRLKINTTTSSFGLNLPSATPLSRQSILQSSPPETPTPTSPPASTAHSPSPLSRYSHSRSSSMHVGRPTSPTSIMSSSSTGKHLSRSMTPGPGHSRSMTPAPPLPRAMTPAPVPALPMGIPRPPVPPKPRQMSSSSPPKYYTRIVDDREQSSGHKEKERTLRRHERWLPSPETMARGK